LIGALSIAVWSVVMSSSFFFVLKKLGRLRVPIICEIIGVDIIYYSDVKEIDGSKYLQ
jgi:ammonia channel protein AmtB